MKKIWRNSYIVLKVNHKADVNINQISNHINFNCNSEDVSKIEISHTSKNLPIIQVGRQYESY